MSIDWSKAPEGATHWQPENLLLRAAWLKKDEDGFFFKCTYQANWIKFTGPVSDLGEIVARPTPWTGEGLPPVGIEIEAFMMRNMHDTYEWRRAKVVHGGIPGSEREILVYDLESTAPAWVDEFRPIRTPEQIAADELRGIIESGLNGRKTLTAVVEEIQAAGYRKQPSP